MAIEPIMVVNSTVPLLEPWASNISAVMGTIQVLIGGVFGLFVVMALYKVFMFHRLSKKLSVLSSEVQELKSEISELKPKSKKKVRK